MYKHGYSIIPNPGLLHTLKWERSELRQFREKSAKLFFSTGKVSTRTPGIPVELYQHHPSELMLTLQIVCCLSYDLH